MQSNDSVVNIKVRFWALGYVIIDFENFGNIPINVQKLNSH